MRLIKYETFSGIEVRAYNYPSQKLIFSVPRVSQLTTKQQITPIIAVIITSTFFIILYFNVTCMGNLRNYRIQIMLQTPGDTRDYTAINNEPQDYEEEEDRLKKKTHVPAEPSQLIAGIATVISGMLIQAMLGIVPTWGNIVVYITSYFRLFDPHLGLSDTFVVFPMTLSMAALAMQLGTVLLDFLHPKVHLFIGGSIFVVSILLASFARDFYLFLVFYAVLTGLGYGIIYMLPLKSAWAFFPNKKGTIGGLILASHSFGAIGWSFFTATSINPTNETPSLHIQLGSSNDLLFSPTSDSVKNVASKERDILGECAVCFTFQKVFFVELTLFIFALILMQKRKVVVFKQINTQKFSFYAPNDTLGTE